MGKGSQRLVSGDSGELLEQDFLAECVEGQVSPDVGANGSNLGKGAGEIGRRTQAERKEERVVTNSRGQCLRHKAKIQC